ncbi:DUF7563 family protein [Halostella limicola]
MPNCENCGEMVSASFARVFGDNEETIYGCVHCLPPDEITKVSATGKTPSIIQ